MSKVQQICEISSTLPLYQESELLSLYRSSFESSELGKLHRLFPFSSLASSFGLRDCAFGRKSYFSAEGKIALMVLKSYTGFSDKRLIQGLNGSIHFQLFCGIFIRPGMEIQDTKIVSKIRCELSRKLKLDDFQGILASHWKPLLSDLHVAMSDATCYESHLRFPTNEKLLWESTQWIYSRIIQFCKALHIRRPRSKYDLVGKRYLSYSRTRKKTQKKKRKLRTSLLYLLNKLQWQLDSIEKQYGQGLELNKAYYKRRSVIREVLSQQQKMHLTGKSMPGRIVSVSKPYIRPIVRGKETKAVEFGAKANLVQVGGVNFIEHIDFNPFNEGTRGISSIQYAQTLVRRLITHFAGDSIYATNKTRKYCSSRQIPIYTSFTRKGRAARDEKQRSLIRSTLSKERATRLEGSFGTEKEHYNLRKIKARTKETEILWILFGIHTANGVRISKKERPKVEEKTKVA